MQFAKQVSTATKTYSNTLRERAELATKKCADLESIYHFIPLEYKYITLSPTRKQSYPQGEDIRQQNTDKRPERK